uniref:Uncharacterized protein n=1 Tax=Bionectria ochroleuca TaxID=29856 RepID=A0A8H7TUT5_BIOOC
MCWGRSLGELLKEALKARQLHPPYIRDRDNIRLESDEPKVRQLIEKWNQEVVMSAIDPICGRFHPVIWDKGRLLTMPIASTNHRSRQRSSESSQAESVPQSLRRGVNIRMRNSSLTLDLFRATQHRKKECKEGEIRQGVQSGNQMEKQMDS